MLQLQKPSLAALTGRFGSQIEAAMSGYTDLPRGCPGQLREAMRYSLLAPGKRLRPLLVVMAAEACGEGGAEPWPAACAVECQGLSGTRH